MEHVLEELEGHDSVDRSVRQREGGGVGGEVDMGECPDVGGQVTARALFLEPPENTATDVDHQGVAGEQPEVLMDRPVTAGQRPLARRSRVGGAEVSVGRHGVIVQPGAFDAGFRCLPGRQSRSPLGTGVWATQIDQSEWYPLILSELRALPEADLHLRCFPMTSDRALAELSKADPVLARLIAAHPGFDPRAWLDGLPSMDLFGALVFQVIGQQLSVRATRRILDRLAARFGGAMPTPAELLAVEPEELARVGLSRRKVATLREVAQRFADGRWREDELRSLSDAEIEDRLTTVSGIGPWTVHGSLIIAFDREDVVLPGDLALRKAIQRAYGIDHLPSEGEVLALAERWRPWRSLATAYLFQAAFEVPEARGATEVG